jgi:hypothetical protein
MTGKGAEVYKYLEPLYNDYRKLAYRSVNGWELIRMDEFIDTLLYNELACDVALPFLPKRLILEDSGLLEPRKSILEDEIEDTDEEKEEDLKGLKKKKKESNTTVPIQPPVVVEPQDKNQEKVEQMAQFVTQQTQQAGALLNEVKNSQVDPREKDREKTGEGEGDPERFSVRREGDRDRESRHGQQRDRHGKDEHRRDRERNRSRDKYRKRSPDRNRDRSRHRESERDRSREKRRDRDRQERSRERPRSRDRSRSRQRSRRDDDKRRSSRDRSRDRHRRRSPSYSSRSSSRSRSRSYEKRSSRRARSPSPKKMPSSSAAPPPRPLPQEHGRDDDFDRLQAMDEQSATNPYKFKYTAKKFDKMFGKKSKAPPVAAVPTIPVKVPPAEGSVEYWNQLRESLGIKKLK